VVELQKDGSAYLRFLRNDMLPGPDDVFVPHQLVRRYDLRDGSLVDGPIEPPRRPGQKPGLRDVVKVDGLAPEEAVKLPRFGELTVIDPDFHYEFGDAGDLSLRVLDLLCPVGRGQRGLIVAPPRTGKTVFLNKVATAMERLYPDVHLMVLLVDERPEEGTMWKRLVKGDVFLSTLDEGSKHHVALTEAVFRRAQRLVECKKDVMLLLDSITRMSRAYNSEIGNSGRILTGGIDSRTMERPKRMFGAARNTEGGGALTILGTTLVDTGSKMDQVIFEEFKGTGNMELVLSRQLADRRIFPAFDIGLSGTRKEEKLLSPQKLKRIVTLRRVLQKMKPIEAMEQLLLKLERTPNNDEFLRQFELSSIDS
jgi:transcription termination factor Rho